MWFQSLTGFPEKSPEQVRENFFLHGEYLVSKVNGKRFRFGKLEISTLKDLKDSVSLLDNYQSKISVSQIVSDVKALHRDRDNADALFQAASQFNLLEMANPSVTPEQGVEMYEGDHTQGPACAVACGAGTIFRNYFVDVNGETGQSSDNQIDCLAAIGEILGNTDSALWELRNGYALASREGLQIINDQIRRMNTTEYESLKGQLKIGLQWDTQVTILENDHIVSQAYCAALPISYSKIPAIYWEPFARMILEATYEATFYAALHNYERTGCRKLFLTLVGGGAFGNPMPWIIDAIKKALQKFAACPLDVRIVSYGRVKTSVERLVQEL